MAAGTEISGEATKNNPNTNSEQRNSESKSELNNDVHVHNLVEMFTKLNPLAKEFFPSSYPSKQNANEVGFDQLSHKDQTQEENLTIDQNYRRRRSFNQGKRRFNGRNFRAQRESSVRRTVYVSDIDQQVTEERLAGLFSGCGQIVDCRVCGDPHSVLRFAFVEFDDEHGARRALNLGGTMLGYYPLRVLPSKTAILPVNPTFLPRSDGEREMCSRTVYCTNIDKQVSQTEFKNFFESACGEVTHIRLLGDQTHSTRIAFIEFAMAESAIVALNCSGMPLRGQPIRVSPSKTPVRSRAIRPMTN